MRRAWFALFVVPRVQHRAAERLHTAKSPRLSRRSAIPHLCREPRASAIPTVAVSRSRNFGRQARALVADKNRDGCAQINLPRSRVAYVHRRRAPRKPPRKFSLPTPEIAQAESQPTRLPRLGIAAPHRPTLATLSARKCARYSDCPRRMPLRRSRPALRPCAESFRHCRDLARHTSPRSTARRVRAIRSSNAETRGRTKAAIPCGVFVSAILSNSLSLVASSRA